MEHGQPIKISSLLERYNLTTRKAIYSRINGLGLELTNRGEITSEQLALLDQLHLFLSENPRNAIADFLRTTEVEVQPRAMAILDREEEDDSLLHTINLLSGLVEKLIFGRGEVRSPLANYRELEEAATNGWILTSSIVAELVGATPHGEVFIRGSFVFTKAGRIGRSCAWRVSKSALTAIASKDYDQGARDGNQDLSPEKPDNPEYMKGYEEGLGLADVGVPYFPL